MWNPAVSAKLRFFGVLLFITIIGIPFVKQYFKMAGLSLAPFGKDVKLNF